MLTDELLTAIARWPHWVSECRRYAIVNADCLSVLPVLPEGSADAVLVDPPYGVRSDEEWDCMEPDELAAFSASWIAKCREQCDRLITFFSTTRFDVIYRLLPVFYPSVRLMVWDKPSGSQYGGSALDGVWFAFEPIFWCTPGYDRSKSMAVAVMIRRAREAKGLSRGGVDMVMRGKKTGLCYRWEEAACLPTRKQASDLCELLSLNGEFIDTLESCYSFAPEAAHRDVFSYRTVTNGQHPCQKPIDLLIELVETVTAVGETVLDPFLGSGTTLVACAKTDRCGIGIEEERKHFDTAVQRVQDELARHPLFAEEERLRQRELIP